jgi:hypothetical protein
MSAVEPPSRWRGAQLDLQAIEAETDCMRLFGLDTSVPAASGAQAAAALALNSS